MNDRIVYTVVNNGGGVDGMDHTDKGGDVFFASFDRKEAESKLDNWKTLVPIVVDMDEQWEITEAKLDPIDRLTLDYHYGDLEY